MLPPIRYPLPTLVLLLVVGLLAWQGEPMTRPLRSSLADRWRRRLEGPPVPHSIQPQVVAGPIVRRALLMHDEVKVWERPEGSSAESQSIRLRMFVDVYDVWPLTGESTFFRVGNRRPIGWVRTQDLLAWNTRLVVRNSTRDSTKALDQTSLPVLGWTSDKIEVATWEPDSPWQALSQPIQIPTSQIRPEDWGVWISRPELLSLLRRTAPSSLETPELTRLRAIIGRLSDDRPLTGRDLAEARAYLPSIVFTKQDRGLSLLESNEALSRVNEHWKPESSWGGVAFQFLPISMLP